jgi:hypothetical protein
VNLANSHIAGSECRLEFLLFAFDQILGVAHTPSPALAWTRCPMRLAKQDLSTMTQN